MDHTNMPLRDAVAGRRSIRRFRSDPVAPETVRAILAEAARSPSGSNLQPWLVHVVNGAARDSLCAAARQTAMSGKMSPEYAYQASPLAEPYDARRKKVGYDLYALLGIERGDMAARGAAMLANFDFFGAPVGMMICIERSHGLGAYLDAGMFMQTFMLLARAHGLETCAQQAWCNVGATVHEVLGIPGDKVIVSGLALGYADWSAPENSLISERASPEEFATFHA